MGKIGIAVDLSKSALKRMAMSRGFDFKHMRLMRHRQKFDGIMDPYFMPGEMARYTGNKVFGYKVI